MTRCSSAGPRRSARPSRRGSTARRSRGCRGWAPSRRAHPRRARGCGWSGGRRCAPRRGAPGSARCRPSARCRRPRPGRAARSCVRGRHVVLQGADVVHLGPVAEIGREDLAAGVPPVDRDVGTDPVVGAAESDGEGAQRRVALRRGRPGGRSTRRRRRGSAARRRRATAPSPAASSVTGTTSARLRIRRARRTPRRRRRSRPRRARTHVRGRPRPQRTRCVAPVHDEHRLGDLATPAGTSTKTGVGRKASLRRTRASPPSCTAPSMSEPPGTSSAPPKAKRGSSASATCERRRRARCAPGRCRTIEPMRRRQRAAEQLLAPPGAGPRRRGGSEVVEVEVVDGRVAPDLLALRGQRRTTRRPRSRRPAGRGATSGPVQGRGSLGAEGVQGQTSFDADAPAYVAAHALSSGSLPASATGRISLLVAPDMGRAVACR